MVSEEQRVNEESGATMSDVSLERTYLAAIYNAMDDGLVVFDMQGQAILINDAEARICGYSSPEDMKQNLDHFSTVFELRTLKGDLVPLDRWPASKVLRGQSVQNEELRGKRIDTGQEWIFSFSCEPVFDCEGKQKLGVTITRDITARKRAEEALRASQELLKAVSDAAPDPVYAKDTDGRMVLANEATLRAIGRPASEVLGRNELEWLAEHPKEAAAIMENDRRIMDSRVPETVEEWLTLQGVPRLFSGRKAPLFDSNGNVIGLVGVSRDITEQRQAEADLRDSEERFRTLADNISQFAWMADRSGWIFWYNRRWYNYTGTNLEQMQGWGWQAVHHPEHVGRVREKFKRHMEQGIPWEDTFPLRSKEGEYRWFLSRAIPIRDQEGKVVRWFGTNTDITESREAEQRIRELNEELESQVQARTSELLAMNEQLQGFTYSVAHDLRQQIRGINANSSILLLDLADKLDANARQVLERLTGSSKRLGTLVDELLAYARLGRAQPTKQQLDLSSMAEEVAAMIIDRGVCKQGTRFVIQPGLTARGDSTMMRLVLENLLDNACKYSSDSEKPVIEFGCSGEAFFIRDNGIGFDMQFANKLWEPFERLHREMEYTGTGIGLANVKRVIEKHGGRVWATGTPRNGATFFFTLPE